MPAAEARIGRKLSSGSCWVLFSYVFSKLDDGPRPHVAKRFLREEFDANEKRAGKKWHGLGTVGRVALPRWGAAVGSAGPGGVADSSHCPRRRRNVSARRAGAAVIVVCFATRFCRCGATSRVALPGALRYASTTSHSRTPGVRATRRLLRCWHAQHC